MDLLMFEEHTVPNDKKDGSFALAEGGGIPGGVEGRTSSLPAMEVDMVDYYSFVVWARVSCVLVACVVLGVEVSTF